MIRLRLLKEKDAELMLEWMHEIETAEVFQKDMSSIMLEKAKEFCAANSECSDISNGDSIHFAIVDDSDDEYRGTISLKNIDFDNLSAEYAISVRKKFHGSGTASEATKLVLEKAVKEYGLHRVYLNVLPTNKKAIRFYEKSGFRYEGVSRDGIVRWD